MGGLPELIKNNKNGHIFDLDIDGGFEDKILNTNNQNTMARNCINLLSKEKDNNYVNKYFIDNFNPDCNIEKLLND